MIGAIILLTGATFTLLAAIGLVRMPDFFTKMHAVSKAGAFGGAIILLLAGFMLGDRAWPFVAMNIIFFYFTTPVAAQMMAKAALQKKVSVWKNSEDKS